MKPYSKSQEIAYLKHQVNEAYESAARLDSIYQPNLEMRDYYISRAKALEMQLTDLHNLRVDGIKVIA